MKYFFVILAILNTNYSIAMGDHIPPSIPYEVKMLDPQFRKVTLVWIGSGDDIREGQAAGYEVGYSLSEPGKNATWDQFESVSFTIHSNPNDKLIKAVLDIEDFSLSGFLAVRAFDEARNYSSPSLSIPFAVESSLSGPNFTADSEQALVAGYHADGRKLLACVAMAANHELPGVFYEGAMRCHAPFKGKRLSHQLFRFIKSRPSLAWQQNTLGSIPVNALMLGTYYGKKAHACRIHHKDGSVVSGYVSYLGCAIGLAGEWEQNRDYEVLVEEK